MAECRSCRATIVWAETVTGRASPFEIDPAGKWAIVDGKARSAISTDETRYTSHFATCPQAKQWRGRK